MAQLHVYSSANVCLNGKQEHWFKFTVLNGKKGNFLYLLILLYFSGLLQSLQGYPVETG